MRLSVQATLYTALQALKSGGTKIKPIRLRDKTIAILRAYYVRTTHLWNFFASNMLTSRNRKLNTTIFAFRIDHCFTYAPFENRKFPDLFVGTWYGGRWFFSLGLVWSRAILYTADYDVNGTNNKIIFYFIPSVKNNNIVSRKNRVQLAW